jgi:hypothetical protein
MNMYPNGKKIIYHNGWWHGNNASFIRMIEDSVTIIVLGNKYNSNIYHAKDLESIFDPGVPSGGEENEEMSSNAPAKRIVKKKARRTLSKKNAIKKHVAQHKHRK